MAPITSNAVKSNHAPKSTQPLVPPEEQFWQRYSPHNEFLLSGVGSFTLHLLVVGGLVLAAVFGLFSLLNKEEKPIEVAAIGLKTGSPGFPGGNNGGGGGGGQPGTPGTEQPAEAVNQNDPKPLVDVVPLKDIPRAQVNPQQFPEMMRDPSTRSYVTQNNDAVGKISRLSKVARDSLIESASNGLPDTPGPNGEGGGKLDNSVKRVMRWTMLFNTKDGNDYIRQLAALGAIIAVPEGNDKYRIMRDLNQRPIQGNIEDPAKIRLIWWVDDRPESVKSLAEGMGLSQVPNHFVAFFPKSLEAKLVKLETSYKGLKEDQIQETRFEIMPKTFEPKVRDQIPKK